MHISQVQEQFGLYFNGSSQSMLYVLQELGLAFDDWDLKYYTALFQDDLKRDPTNVELFDMAQSNSEHSRHWFFGANIVIDGQAQPESLMKIMKSTLAANLNNSVIGFHDNSSAIRSALINWSSCLSHKSI